MAGPSDCPWSHMARAGRTGARAVVSPCPGVTLSHLPDRIPGARARATRSCTSCNRTCVSYSSKPTIGNERSGHPGFVLVLTRRVASGNHVFSPLRAGTGAAADPRVNALKPPT